MTRYKIIVNGRCVKTYPLEKQAYTWCLLKGYVYWAHRYGYILDENVKIEVENERKNIQ